MQIVKMQLLFSLIFYVFVMSEMVTQKALNPTANADEKRSFIHDLQSNEAKQMGNDIESNNYESYDSFIGFDLSNPLLKTLLVLCLYLVIASLIKLGYHQSPFLTNTIPESCVLIMIGLGLGAFWKIFLKDQNVEIIKFTPDLFFFALMPPIILESAHTLYDQHFFDNVITIIMFAVVGTLINVILIGISLYLFVIFEFRSFPNISLIELLLFSNAISAVDPVTVLTIFQDLKVNKPLYYLVFGESLLNDAVVIVLHDLLSSFVSTPIVTTRDIILGVNSFIFKSVGGFMTGAIFGVFTSVITLYTYKANVIEPMIMVAMTYLSFLVADMFKWSGLISLIGCGLVQLEFVYKNISQKSRTTFKYFVKSLSSVSDLLIFFFLGQMLINEEPNWNHLFVVITLTFCLLYRLVSVITLAYISNNYFHRTRVINLEEQVLMAFGGLRGAVAFAMIALLDSNEITNIPLFKTTTFVVILFTVFVLGGTTKPLLNFLRIQRDTNEDKKLSIIINNQVIDKVLNGIEDFVGNPSTINWLKNKLKEFIEFLAKYIAKGKETKMEKEIKKLQKDDELTEKSSDKVTKIHSTQSQILKENTKKIIEKMINTFDLKKNFFNTLISNKLNKTVYIVEKVDRNHNIPHKLSSKVIIVNKAFKSSNRNIFSLRSDMNSKELKTRFQTIGSQTDVSKDKKPIQNKIVK